MYTFLRKEYETYLNIKVPPVRVNNQCFNSRHIYPIVAFAPHNSEHITTN